MIKPSTSMSIFINKAEVYLALKCICSILLPSPSQCAPLTTRLWGAKNLCANHKVCALKRLPRFRTLISEIVLLKIHYNEGLSPLSVPWSSAWLKYEQVIRRICLILQWAQWHRITKQLLGKAFGTGSRLPLLGGSGEYGKWRPLEESELVS